MQFRCLMFWVYKDCMSSTGFIFCSTILSIFLLALNFYFVCRHCDFSGHPYFLFQFLFLFHVCSHF
jgi:hypothetical protein